METINLKSNTELTDEQIKDLRYSDLEKLMSKMINDGSWKASSSEGKVDHSLFYKKLIERKTEIEKGQIADARQKLENRANNQEILNSVEMLNIIELLKREMEREGTMPEVCIKDTDTLLISGDKVFTKNVISAEKGMYGLLKKREELFKNLNLIAEGGGISAELVTPIGTVDKVVIYIGKM
jgi:NADH dehydrogenase/NADH:ubiquinone oxidoreductase subunit G